jgi:LmbE family N-acetylglucosaminyl deacetylase
LRRSVIAAVAAVIALTAAAQDPPKSKRTILAVGAHAGDMELTCGALLLKESERGDRVVILHLTLGERGNPALRPDAYGDQKKAEGSAAAAALGAEVIFGPYHDGEIPNDDAARRYVAGVIRQVRPTLVITHWKSSMHKDHAATSAIVSDAILLASFDGWRGVRSIWYAENWEDAEGFAPYIYFDVTSFMSRWRDAVAKYAFVRGGISSFAYLDYYTALATVRGAEAFKGQAEAFDVDAYAKRRVLDEVP